MSQHALHYFFNPTAVAIIGASRDQQKIGRQILDNVITGGFSGPIYPINLEGGKIAGRLAYRSIADIPGRNPLATLVVIAIPTPFVLPEIKKCAARGIKNIIVISAGFKEGGADGRLLEEEIKQYAKQKKLNILGPNCLGLVSSVSRLNATFSAAYPGSGRVALLSQSGAIGSAALDWLQMKHLNFRYFISLGNKAVLQENQILEYLKTDKKISLIVAYLEEIEDGERLMSLISRLVKHCPVAILKAGTSLAGSQLSKSHTGSLAGSSQAVRAGMERAGAMWLNDLEDLFNLLTLTSTTGCLPVIKSGQKISIISNAGGLAVLAADEISRCGLPFGQSLDILGDAKASAYQTALKKALADPAVNPLLVLLTPQTATEPALSAEAVVKLARLFPSKTILTSFVGGRAVQSASDLLQKNNIPNFDYPEEAIDAWTKIYNYQLRLKSVETYNLPAPIKSKPGTLSGDYLESFTLLKKYGIPTVKYWRYDANKVNSYKYPVVLKLVGPADWHKSDRGGIVLNLNNATALKAAAVKLKKDNRSAFKKLGAYLVVQEQASAKQEIILGLKRDESFGPLILVGQGGIYAQIIKDWRIAIADLNFSRALKLIKSLKIYPILNGARGQRKYDIKALARAIVSLVRLAQAHPEIKELDINPIFVKTKGVFAGDVRIIA
jgi:acetyltransferase